MQISCNESKHLFNVKNIIFHFYLIIYRDLNVIMRNPCSNHYLTSVNISHNFWSNEH